MIKGKIGGLEVTCSESKRTHIRELFYFTLFVDNIQVAKVSFFTGREYYPPWIELDYDPWLRKRNLETDLFKLIYEKLDCNGKLFVTYDKDKETEGMILKGYSAVDTPLGRSMLEAGFTWFKTWYIPEGGNEGSAKIQGNKSCNLEDSVRQLRELLDDVKTEEVKQIILKRIDDIRKSRDNTV
ncbi:DUF1122 family protein [Sulfuracidifex tepidarius]|uniref:DUF1122 domain-containing protein n=1 Tax=Sulfuracidifex tepidarius TaxID=1294262 RepID=A0A510E4J0_9CREN|nr:DUF1122 family protein [Sulfuracidifex tepidarius]BBG24626.1 hypothetical protein IC006_1957 [Sulfuracidifex tepidarius]BBG27414.1 hypothetical protein IC007_1965 [Sulfuracidifex tepidarius]